MSITAVSPILQQLTDSLRAILDGRLIGIYLYGSLIAGDFDRHVSDLDLAVVMTRPLDDAAFSALHGLHQQVVAAFPDWDDRLELAYISHDALQTFRTQTSRIGIISPGEAFHQLDAGADWLISWHALREDGAALYGPSVKTLIPPIPRAEYIQAVREHIQLYRHATQYTPGNSWRLSYIMLTTVRGLYTVRNGHPASKVKAAAWAKTVWPQWAGIIDRALQWRSSSQPAPLHPDEIHQVQAHIHAMLDQLPE